MSEPSSDFVQRTRPQIVRNCARVMLLYCLGCWIYRAFTHENIFDWQIASVISAPVWGYFGFRTGDKIAEVFKRAG